VDLQESRELRVVREIVCQASRDLGGVRHVAFPDQHVPERKLGFGVAEEV
jgi:hypothetical protein